MSQLVDGNDDAETDDTEGSGPSGGTTTPHMYVPPGARAHCFGEDFEGHFCVPARLQDKSADLVEAVNDFHYAMINDHPRNEFYRECLRRAIVPGESVVLEIGTGSGLLAMLAARLGARKVVAIEASRHMAALARKNIAANGLDGAITVIERLSTELDADEIRRACGLGAGRVVEVNGTEDGGGDVKPYAADLPDVLYAALVECDAVAKLTKADDWGGLDLSHVNVLQDTASLVFAKQYGFRFCSVPSTFLAPPVTVFACDFTRDAPGFVPSETTVDFAAAKAGVAHCVVLFWDATWGQGIQLLEDLDAANRDDALDPANALTRPPTPFVVAAGEPLSFDVRLSSDSVVLQFQLNRRHTAP
ncbi:hypothetical protein JL720_12047 [Aureococcus anophagefferens]|nr:hypothetical protein JL720_12047 [Aureococcus anophagefferens]